MPAPCFPGTLFIFLIEPENSSPARAIMYSAAGGWFHVAALTVMGALSLSGIEAWWTIVGPHMVLSFGSGFLVPTSGAGAVGMFPKLAGTAASWVGLAQMGMGMLITLLFFYLGWKLSGKAWFGG